MTGNTFTELLKTYFKFKRKEEDPPALDPVVDAITNCNWRSMGSFASTAFSNAVEHQKTLSMLSDELLKSVMTASSEAENAKLKEIVKTLDTVEKTEENKEEKKKDIWDQLIDMAEDTPMKGDGND